MTRWKITIEYDGTYYAGGQRQDNVPSIQGEIEKAVHKFCQQKLTVTGASRTDSGVHAQGQIAHFDLDYGDRSLRGFDLMKALNAHLRPQPISILHAEEVDEHFHARFSAHEKLYTYRIINKPSFLALDQNRAWIVKTELDVAAMQAAAEVLRGEHDFASFRASECQANTSIRSVNRLEFEERNIDPWGGREILMHVEGHAFLHHMVRNIVGALIEVGRGGKPVGWLKDLLLIKDRTQAAPTAKPDGLYLVNVSYPDEMNLPQEALGPYFFHEK